MRIRNIPFTVVDWSTIKPTRHAGESGIATWRTQYFGPESDRIRVRLVEYSAGYVSDHWCSKGHILFCIEGSLETEVDDKRKFTLGPGMSYQVADDADAHRSRTTSGATLLIVD